MAVTTLESFLNPLITKRDRRCSLSLSSSFYVRFKPVHIPAIPHSTSTGRTWTNVSIVTRKLESSLGTCFLSLDPIHQHRRFNSRLVVAVPFVSAAKQDDDSDEHSEIDVENHDQKNSTTTHEIIDDVENEIKKSSSDQIEVLKNAAEELSIEAAANYWRQILLIRMQLVKEYLISADNYKSPEEVIKDIIVETFALSSTDIDRLKLDASKLQDFYLGIPYGALLSLGGFLSFMITGSISGIRFGVILGGTLLALSISSLRHYSYASKRDQSSASQAIMKLGQTAIAGIIFLRHLGLLFQRPSFPNSFTALISGGMVVFYLYTIMLDGGHRKKKSKLA